MAQIQPMSRSSGSSSSIKARSLAIPRNSDASSFVMNAASGLIITRETFLKLPHPVFVELGLGKLDAPTETKI